MLPPHDSETNRTAIHTAFDLFLLAHEAGDQRMAAQWRGKLRLLTREAHARRTVLLLRAPVPTDASGRHQFRAFKAAT